MASADEKTCELRQRSNGPTIEVKTSCAFAAVSNVPAGIGGTGIVGVTLVPASMRRLAIDGVAYRTLDPAAPLSAPIRLVTRHAATPRGTGATATRFRDTVRQLAG